MVQILPVRLFQCLLFQSMCSLELLDVLLQVRDLLQVLLVLLLHFGVIRTLALLKLLRERGVTFRQFRRVSVLKLGQCPLLPRFFVQHTVILPCEPADERLSVRHAVLPVLHHRASVSTPLGELDP